MSKAAMDILLEAQAARVDRIKQYEEACRTSFSAQMGYAFLTGCELNAAKEELPHGKFAEWREKFLPQIPERSAQRYMKFADQIRHSGGIADSGKLKLLGNGDLNEKDKEKVLEAVHEIADGKTLTQLYRDLGVIREKKAPQPPPRKALSPEEKQADRKKAAQNLMGLCCAPLTTLMIDPQPTLAELTKSERRQFLDLLVSASTEIRKFKS